MRHAYISFQQCFRTARADTSAPPNSTYEALQSTIHMSGPGLASGSAPEFSNQAALSDAILEQAPVE